MECSCGETAIYYRRYEGNGYCKGCLSGQIEKSFSSNANVKHKDRVAVGVSGGKDSSVLLHLLNKMKGKRQFELVAIAIDEGIHGYRDKSLDIAKKMCDNLNVKLHVCSFEKEFNVRIEDLPPKEKHCTYCGVFRRYLLNKKASELGCTKLAIGHNMDDEAQSVMMNVIRNDLTKFAATTETSGMVTRIKPLSNVPEKEVAAYALLNDIDFFEGECPNSFDNMRREVMNIINDLEANHPGTKQQLVKFSKRVNVEPANREIQYCECGQPSSSKTCKTCKLLGKITS